MDRLTIATSEGAVLSAKLWRPKKAAAQNPVPAVILVPGGNANDAIGMVGWSADVGRMNARLPRPRMRPAITRLAFPGVHSFLR
ncbi:MAG: hypothetical protein AA931_08630 [Peptococcaceae bacterium 1109]|nr:MAG: hypothetical protein AA931_08630 [Peptococcaceae bacterium 1109]